MDGKEVSLKRKQAERNVKAHIDKILSDAASEIAKSAKEIRLPSSESVFETALWARSKRVIDEARNEIDTYIKEYSKAAILVIGDKDTGATGRLLNSELFGKTFKERSEEYMRYFFSDCAKVIYAARKMKIKSGEIEKTLQNEYKDPYANGTIGKASAKNINIPVEKRKHGLYKAGYGNIVRNAQGTIAIAWSREEYNFAKRSGAIGFIPHRGSSYPCDLCDSHAERFHKMGDPNDPPPLYHSRCCCWTTYVYDKEKD